MFARPTSRIPTPQAHTPHRTNQGATVERERADTKQGDMKASHKELDDAFTDHRKGALKAAAQARVKAAPKKRASRASLVSLGAVAA